MLDQYPKQYIRQYRELLFMTQTELAAKIDLTNTAVCRHEAGNRKIGPETERLYNKALGAVSIRKKP